MCLSQQDILLLAILHGAPVLTASAVTKSPTYTDSRVNLRLQALIANGHSSEPPSCAGQHYGVIIAVNVWSWR